MLARALAARGFVKQRAQENTRQEPGVSQKSDSEATQWLEAVVDVSRQIANLEELPTVLQSIVTLAREIATADVAAITLLDHDQSRLVVQCFAAKRDHTEPPHTCNAINDSIIMRAIQEGRALCFPQNCHPDETTWHCSLIDQSIHAAAVVPLRLDNTSIGALVVARHAKEHFTSEDVNGLAHLADQTVIALEHASMTSRIQSIAITEERYRIAREMHDSLAQVLGYLNLQMQTLEMLVSAGNQQQALAELTTARQSIRTAQDDVRDSILSLRTTLSDELALPVALKEYVIEFGVQTGLDTHFHSSHAESPPVTPLANVEIVRIVQEALTNVRKHAQADTINVTIVVHQSMLEIAVIDDGIGFDVATDAPGHFGLSTMEERARQVGGVVNITSSPGAGTTVRLRVPLTLQI